MRPWTLRGFYDPVEMHGHWNSVKGGSTVPLKFEVFQGRHELTHTSAISSFTKQKVACSPRPACRRLSRQGAPASSAVQGRAPSAVVMAQLRIRHEAGGLQQETRALINSCERD